jgi:hypothetical protein
MTTPSAPNGGSYIYMGSTMICLTWAEPENDGGAPITTYMVTMTPDGQPTTEHLVQAPEHTYIITDIVYGISIQATVKASNDGGNIYGPEFRFPLIVPILPPQSPPASAEAAPLESGTASISWTAPEVAPEGNARYFIMSVSSNLSDITASLETADMAQLNCILNGLNPESEYHFTVQVVNQVGSSTATNTNIIVFPSEPAPI